jgi:hypothetical protein
MCPRVDLRKVRQLSARIDRIAQAQHHRCIRAYVDLDAFAFHDHNQADPWPQPAAVGRRRREQPRQVGQRELYHCQIVRFERIRAVARIGADDGAHVHRRDVAGTQQPDRRRRHRCAVYIQRNRQRRVVLRRHSGHE